MHAPTDEAWPNGEAHDLNAGRALSDTTNVSVSTVTIVDEDSNFSLRRSTLDFGLGGQRSKGVGVGQRSNRLGWGSKEDSLMKPPNLKTRALLQGHLAHKKSSPPPMGLP